MCGIIGYTGIGNAVSKMTKGLSVLEYRGYDSVGLAAFQKDHIAIYKCQGRIGALNQILQKSSLGDTNCAIGHTRWATHGMPSDMNAHPHRYGDVVLVHNGIIENYKDLQEQLSFSSANLVSETDTEVAAAYSHYCYCKDRDPVTAIRTAVSHMKGTYAFAILLQDRPGELYAVRSGSPLVLAKGTDGYYLASDITALLPFSSEYYYLAEDEIACLTAERVTLARADGSKRFPLWSQTTLKAEETQKGEYPHFMLKEIYEQPEALQKSVSSRIKDGLPDFSADGISPVDWMQIQQIQIVGCGSAMHAGLAGVHWLENIAKIPAAAYIASEYRYNPPIAQKGTLVILLSQSGETADTLAALRYAKANGLPTLAIVNAPETTIAREADKTVYTYAGPEIAVATTKGYCTQVSVLLGIAAAIGYTCGHISADEARNLVRAINYDAPAAVEEVLKQKSVLSGIAKRLAEAKHIFYIGRGVDYALVQEGALKLKEISYIHAEAYAAGELKHGTISLIEEGTPVIVVSTEESLFEKTLSSIREVRSRGAYTVLLTSCDVKITENAADACFRLSGSSREAAVFAAVTAMQLLGYETARLLGCDIDRPRNLAKSVTVE